MGVKLQIMSDLHLDCQDDHGQAVVASLVPEPDSVLVLAGDIWSGAPREQANTEERLNEFLTKWQKVVYVPGNHFYYHTTREVAEKFLYDLEFKYRGRFIVLDRFGVRMVDGQRFLGDTMWFPKLSRCWEYEPRFSDFRYIAGLADWCYARNAAFREFLDKNLQAGDVVVTHHLPAHGSISTRFIGAVTNMFFISNMEDIIQAKKPALWIHGHTHDQFDYKHHDTRIVANPRGYDWEASQETWNPSKVIEL